VTITVDAVNDVPTTQGDAYATDEDSVLVIDAASGVLVNDSDSDEDTLTTVLESSPSHGDLTFGSDGSFTYTPDADFNGTDSFTYRVDDGTDYSSETTVAITVHAINDAPVAADDAYRVSVDDVLTADVAAGVLANDEDADGDTLTATLAVNVSNGSLTLNSDGSFTYTPTTGFHGEDSFTYTISDGAEASAPATVAIVYDPVDTVELKLEVASTDGTPISTVEEGEEFVVNVYVTDLRETPEGVFAAYFDLLYDSSLVAVNGAIQYDGTFPNGRTGDTTTEGIVDELGAFTSSSLGEGEFLLLSVPFIALESGSTTVFVADPADNFPSSETLLFGSDSAVPVNAIDYVNASVAITTSGGGEGEGGQSATYEETVDQVFAEEDDWLGY
jgi:VCBS repeat-containing protein